MILIKILGLGGKVFNYIHCMFCPSILILCIGHLIWHSSIKWPWLLSHYCQTYSDVSDVCFLSHYCQIYSDGWEFWSCNLVGTLLPTLMTQIYLYFTFWLYVYNATFYLIRDCYFWTRYGHHLLASPKELHKHCFLKAVQLLFYQ